MSNHIRKMRSPVVLVLFLIVATPGRAYCREKASGDFFSDCPFRLIGDTDAVWLIQSRNNRLGYRLAVKPLDEKKPWRCVGGDRRGRVTVAAAVGENLIVFFSDGGHMRYSPHRSEGNPGINPPADLWPEGARALAACRAGNDTGGMLVLIARSGTRRTTTQPATATSTATSPRSVSPDTPRLSSHPKRELVLLQYAGQKWQQIAVVPDKFAQSKASKPPLRALLAAGHKTIHILLDLPRPVLTALEDGKWRSGALPDTKAATKPAGGKISPLSMTVIKDSLALATFDSADGLVSIASRSSKPDKPAGKWEVIKVRRSDKPVTWPNDAPPGVAKFGKQLAFAWEENDEWLFAACELDGKLGQSGPLDVFAMAGRRELVERVHNLFFWGVFGVIVVLMFWPGQTLRTAPFSLPPMMFPARLGRRLVAAVIDVLPFMIPASILATRGIDIKPASTFRELIEQAGVIASYPGFLYAFLAFMIIYPAYCYFMERRFAATVGKMVMRLRVVGDAGRPATPRELALRNVSKIIEFLGLPLAFPLLFPLLTRYRQRLGDKISWTAVIDAELSLPTPPPEESEEQTNHSAGENKEEGSGT